MGQNVAGCLGHGGQVVVLRAPASGAAHFPPPFHSSLFKCLKIGKEVDVGDVDCVVRRKIQTPQML
jgi:hypothetical protein